MLRTARLRLREWTRADLEPFAQLNADPVVMEHFPAPSSRAQSDAFAEGIRSHFEEHGWGLWAVEVVGGAPFIGFVGLHEVHPPVPCAPVLEVGWRLARAHWGRGYATEAAERSLAYAFEVLTRDEVVSFTAATNLPSQRVMQRLGMRRDPAEDFEHPKVPVGCPVRPHVLYRIRAAEWRAGAVTGLGVSGKTPM